MIQKFTILIPLALMLGACAQEPEPATLVYAEPVPARDRLHTPRSVESGKLQYTPNYETFAPVMSNRVAQPTQEQANYAFQRSRYHGQSIELISRQGNDLSVTETRHAPSAFGVRLFACKAGSINEITMRVQNFRGHVVHCATDMLDVNGNSIARVPLNYYYWKGAWHLHDPKIYVKRPKWINAQPSPPRNNGWFGDRY